MKGKKTRNTQPKLIQAEIESLNRSITGKEIELVIKSFQQRKA